MRAAAAVILLACSTGAASAFEYRNASTPPPVPPAEIMGACLSTAARTYEVDEAILYLILRIEDGRLGRITRNASGAPPDVGPAQVNGQWIGRIAARWQVDRDTAFHRLRDDFCWNLDAAGWIARQAFEDCTLGFWRCFARYHSPTPHFQERYLRLAAGKAKAMLLKRVVVDPS